MTVTVNEAVPKSSEASASRPSGDSVVITDQIREVLLKGLHQEIPLLSLRLARPENKKEKGFFNARTKKGLEPESIAQMMEWITDHGLISPVAVRPFQEQENLWYEIVAGERRTRAIQELVRLNQQVYCQKTDSLLPASVVYENVRCFVLRNASDERAIEISHMENDSHVPIPEGDVIFLCEWMMQHNYDRERICKVLKKSPGWLSQTLNFRSKLDPATFNQLCEGELSRSFCLRLTDFSENDRPNLKDRAIEVATERHEEQKEIAAADVVEAKIHLEVAEAKMEVAGTPVKVEVAARKVDRAKKRVVEAEDKACVVDQQPIVPQQSDIDQSAFEAGLNPLGTKGLSTKQIHDHWVTTIDGLLDSGETIRNQENQRAYPKRDLQIARAVAQAISQGSRDILGALDQFYQNQGSWGTGSYEKFIQYRQNLADKKTRLNSQKIIEEMDQEDEEYEE